MFNTSWPPERNGPPLLFFHFPPPRSSLTNVRRAKIDPCPSLSFAWPEFVGTDKKWTIVVCDFLFYIFVFGYLSSAVPYFVRKEENRHLVPLCFFFPRTKRKDKKCTYKICVEALSFPLFCHVCICERGEKKMKIWKKVRQRNRGNDGNTWLWTGSFRTNFYFWREPHFLRIFTVYFFVLPPPHSF